MSQSRRYRWATPIGLARFFVRKFGLWPNLAPKNGEAGRPGGRRSAADR